MYYRPDIRTGQILNVMHVRIPHIKKLAICIIPFSVNIEISPTQPEPNSCNIIARALCLPFRSIGFTFQPSLSLSLFNRNSPTQLSDSQFGSFFRTWFLEHYFFRAWPLYQMAFFKSAHAYIFYIYVNATFHTKIPKKVTFIKILTKKYCCTKSLTKDRM